MFTVDMRDFERMAEKLGGMPDQLRYATAQTLNAAAERTRDSLIKETWPSAVTVRNRSFMGASLTTKGRRATKKLLAVEIYDKLGRASLQQHAKGGRRDQHRRVVAIPPSSGKTVRRGARGVPQAQRPAAIIAATPKKALRLTPRGLFVGEGGRLRLRYTFAPSARVKPDVPFYEDFRRVMSREMKAAFPIQIGRAMATRRAT